MTILMVGLAIFLGMHSVRIVAGPWRQAQIARRGEASWKLGYSVLSAIGLGLSIWGYGIARQRTRPGTGSNISSTGTSTRASTARTCTSA